MKIHRPFHIFTLKVENLKEIWHYANTEYKKVYFICPKCICLVVIFKKVWKSVLIHLSEVKRSFACKFPSVLLLRMGYLTKSQFVMLICSCLIFINCIIYLYVVIINYVIFLHFAFMNYIVCQYLVCLNYGNPNLSVTANFETKDMELDRQSTVRCLKFFECIHEGFFLCQLHYQEKHISSNQLLWPDFCKATVYQRELCNKIRYGFLTYLYCIVHDMWPPLKVQCYLLENKVSLLHHKPNKYHSL